MREAPWLRLYPAGVDSRPTPGPASMADAWDATVARRPDAPCIHHFDRTLTFREVDEAAAALAHGLCRGGVLPGERVAIYLQNDPQWLVAMLAAWRAGAIPVAVNPMLKGRELVHHLDDAGAAVLICLERLHHEVVASVVDRTTVRWTITTHPLDLTPDATVPDTLRDSIGDRHPPEGTTELRSLLRDATGTTDRAWASPGPDDVAILTYTSGTTGASKGAMNLHRGMVHNSRVFADWFDLDETDCVLGMAPLFHITGIVAGMGVTIVSGAAIVLSHRFDAAEVLASIERRSCTFTVGTITAYIAMATEPSLRDRDVSSLTKAASGGAAISPAALGRIHEAMGMRVSPVYGLTETTSPTHITPPEVDPPVDPSTGALAVGIPVPGLRIRIVDVDEETDVAPGESGEVVMAGPMVVPGYWQRPEESARAVRDGWMYTGDIGVMDADGWLFIVDRKKDLINAGGYKIWPREVEDVLYTHPAVREAAVVGVPDDYRGETVKAVVSLVPDQQATPEELVRFCREHMAAYKYPRLIEIRDELPKTLSGKVLRRELR